MVSLGEPFRFQNDVIDGTTVAIITMIGTTIIIESAPWNMNHPCDSLNLVNEDSINQRLMIGLARLSLARARLNLEVSSIERSESINPIDKWIR